MSLLWFPLLLNLFLLPFYVTKFHRRFLTTWHLIPLLGAQWGFVMSSAFLSRGSVDLARDLAVMMFGVGIITLPAFFYSWLARRDAEVLKKQTLNASLPRNEFLSLLSLRYFSIPVLVILVMGLTSLRKSDLVLLLSSIILFWFSRRQLGKLYADAKTRTPLEQPLVNSDFYYLAIPIGMSVAALGVLMALRS